MHFRRTRLHTHTHTLEQSSQTTGKHSFRCLPSYAAQSETGHANYDKVIRERNVAIPHYATLSRKPVILPLHSRSLRLLNLQSPVVQALYVPQSTCRTWWPLKPWHPLTMMAATQHPPVLQGSSKPAMDSPELVDPATQPSADDDGWNTPPAGSASYTRLVFVGSPALQRGLS